MARNRASPGQQLPGVERAVRTLTCAATARSAGSRASARARTDRRACTTARGPTDGNRMARALPPDLARVGELRRPEVPVRDARAVRFGGLAMTPTPRPASDPLSALGKIAAPFIKDALREEAYKERIRAITVELAEAKRQLEHERRVTDKAVLDSNRQIAGLVTARDAALAER